MAERQPAAATKISCEVYASLAPPAEAALAALGIGAVLQHSRRALALRERAPLPWLPPGTRLEQDPVEVFEVYVPREAARGVLLAWARALQLFTPGRGAIYAEEVELLAPPGLELAHAGLAAPDESTRPGERLAPLSLINCVLQRGRADEVARTALETGTNVPSVNFGTGTGVRDRLGLLRIAIPADKEVLSLLVDVHEQQEILDTLIDAGRIDQPGRGFIAAYAVAFGVPNPRGFRGRQRHAATMDQIIAAIDHLQSGTEWRRRAAGGLPPRRDYLRGLCNVTLQCNEGSSAQVLATAMRGGAGGATISRARLVSPTGRTLAALPGRELIDLGLAPDRLPGLIAALADSGAFGSEAACAVETKALPLAFTYVAP